MYIEYKTDMDENAKKVLQRMEERDKEKFWLFKRFLDISLTLFALLFAIIPMVVIWLLIFISDVHCSPLFVQERVGRHGKIFKMYKFRTMIPNADKMLVDMLDKNEKDGPVFKIKNDPRITRLGRLLRVSSLDELPQLFNVLKGDMSLIGPRPPLPREVEQYTEYQKLRLTVTPGITCIWQVQPNRDDISFDEWVRMDIFYILHRSVSLDIKIVLLTVVAVLKGYGS